MNYVFPKIFKTKFANNAVLDVDPSIQRYSAGLYIQKGKMKAVVTSINNDLLEVNLPEKTLVLDDGYKLYSSDELIKWESAFGESESWRYDVLNKGWKLISLEQGTINICLFHTVSPDDDIINIIHNKDKISNKVDLTNAIWGYSVKCVEGEEQIMLPENHFLCLAHGKALINGQLKNKKTWIRSTKDQTLDIVNQHDESIFFISKIK